MNNDDVREECNISTIRQIDNKIKSLVKILNDYIIARLISKILEGAILAILIGVIVFYANAFYDNYTKITNENKKIERLAIGNSETFMSDLFQIPQVEYIDNNKYKICVYKLQNANIVAYFDNGSMVAYFITITDKKRKLKIPYEGLFGEIILGQTKYYDISDEANGEVNLPAAGMYHYYTESYNYGRHGAYNKYIFANTVYGANDSQEYDIILTAKRHYYDEVKSDLIEHQYTESRKKASPSTFGVIREGYENHISVIPSIDDWLNMFHILCN